MIYLHNEMNAVIKIQSYFHMYLLTWNYIYNKKLREEAGYKIAWCMYMCVSVYRNYGRM